jgi:galactokinase
MDAVLSYIEHFKSQPTLSVRAPGRVNLLGEHVDYNGGIVLPAAIDREVRLAAAPTGDQTVRLYAADLEKQVEFSLDRLNQKVDVDGAPLPHWALYPAGVAWALQEAGRPVNGIRAAYLSSVPIGAGLSSSAAVEMAFATAWKTLDGWESDCLTVAKLGQRAENAYVGINTGLMDQFASACGQEGFALYFDTRSLEWQTAPLPPDTAIVIADSGVRRALSNSAYNERRASCEEAVALLGQWIPNVKTLRDVPPNEFMAYSDRLPEVTRKRAEYVVKEIARVETALTALRRGDGRTFGALMFACHAGLRDLYEVSVPELDTLVEIARGLPGCLGARLTGAGFGGCTVNLVQAEQAEAFTLALSDAYTQKTGRSAQVYVCQASQGAQAARLDG